MNLLTLIIPQHLKQRLISLRNHYFNGYAVKSYSQEGEDLVLKRFFEINNNSTGFYVDVGAHHPIRFSNTYLFYKKGWRGINIDATPGSMNIFKKLRPLDINLENAVSDSGGFMPYYIFMEPALNTFSDILAKEYIDGGHKILKEVSLELHPLSEILDGYVEPGRKIDFLSVDVEGFDFQVIRSNDWSKFRPELVLVESLGFDLMDSGKSELQKFMVSVGYNLFAKTVNTLFFKRNT